MKDLFDRILANKGPLGKWASQAEGYFVFPKLEGPISNRMKFQGKDVITWSINDYLGLANLPEIKKVDGEAAAEYGSAYPMGARMMSGHTEFHEQLEQECAAFVEKEACPNNLAPTTSTTAQLVMGDALAVCLQDLRGFSVKDFAKYHPGGALGKRLYLRVSDLIENNQVPQVQFDSSIAEVIVEISEKRLGVTAVLKNEKIIGIITDGDIRRMLSKTTDINSFTANDIMGENPKTVSQDAMAIEALEKLESNSITQILVVDANTKYTGVVHLHDLIKEGIF